MSGQRRSARVAFEWLQGQPQAMDLAAQARRLAELQQTIDRISPLAGLKVASCTGRSLVLIGQSAALAAKFRHAEQSMVADLQAAGWGVDQIRVKVRPTVPEPVPPPPVPKAPVPPGGLRALEALRASTTAGPLREALDRLLRRQAGRRP